MKKDYVKMWEEDLEIPTYPVGEADKNPMFLEKRVYQGSSGKVYPLPFTEKIYDKKVSKEYRVVYLENPYLKIMIMPEIGGRIQRAYDKTNGYDFVYYNQVIKPALVGLTGPWISGGIEFNWPQHHRPRTFAPLEYTLVENEDGSKTVYLSEIDRMYGTKGMAGITLYPDKAYLEIAGQLYNGTKLPQSFLWWANPAVAVNDQYKSIFPPDVNAVFDHGKRDVSTFPLATGEYYKVDYSDGVDISMYKNIPVPTSYMAYHSDYDFVGGYDFGREAGILHVADHHIAPGKKQWTWGNGDFGQAWYRNLTDEDGPYIELMTGVYTDNQPDFTWLQPYEEKTFKQYFMPYKQLGEVKNANKDVLVNLEFAGAKASLAVYTTSIYENLQIRLNSGDDVLVKEIVTTGPEKVYKKEINFAENRTKDSCELKVITDKGDLLISYQTDRDNEIEVPKPAKPAVRPAEIDSNERLFLTGLHLEQYRHATYEPDPYYLEGLKRDPGDIRINNAYGRLLFRRGMFAESEVYFRRAIERLTWKNPNPYNGEPYYNLGLTLKMQGKLDEAFDAFYQAVWNEAWQASGYYVLAQIACLKSNYGEALKYVDKSIIKNYHHIKARNLKTMILRVQNRMEEARDFAQETFKIDRLDFLVRNELYLINSFNKGKEQAQAVKEKLSCIMRDSHHNYLETAIDYAEAGFYNEAVDLLERLIERASSKEKVYPMIYYYLGYYCEQIKQEDKSWRYYELAVKAQSDYCFPHRANSISVLERAMEVNEHDPRAPYYLGNLYYDKKQYQKALSLWEKAREEDNDFPTVHRNLALAYYNKEGKTAEARISLEKAFELNPTDARVLFELDQLYKKIQLGHLERLAFLEENMSLIKERDDLYNEYLTLYNNIGKYQKALELLKKRKFHPWEGGEGKVTAQYVFSLLQLARLAVKEEKYQQAVNLLLQAKEYPVNLGEGKLPIVQENDINYYLGLSYQRLGKKEQAEKYLSKASQGPEEPSDMFFYNDQPADLIFYQGLALRELGDETGAVRKFKKLLDYGKAHLDDKIEIDYFAVSLPDFLVFDADLEQKNKVHCHYLMALGLLGLGKYQKAEDHLSKAHNLNINHQGVLVHLDILKEIAG